MVSTITIAAKLGIRHKKVKELMLRYNIKGVGAGLENHERVCLIDEEGFMDKLNSGAKSLKRGKKKTVKK
mgnify:FL=1|jgi:hypothetical protein|tara:strand:- start:541 stop:750 length:210 start_codon:yes stop_codon:yes gene_type:complete